MHGTNVKIHLVYFMSVNFVNKVADDLLLTKETVNEESSCCKRSSSSWSV